MQQLWEISTNNSDDIHPHIIILEFLLFLSRISSLFVQTSHNLKTSQMDGMQYFHGVYRRKITTCTINFCYMRIYLFTFFNNLRRIMSIGRIIFQNHLIFMVLIIVCTVGRYVAQFANGATQVTEYDLFPTNDKICIASILIPCDVVVYTIL